MTCILRQARKLSGQQFSPMVVCMCMWHVTVGWRQVLVWSLVAGSAVSLSTIMNVTVLGGGEHMRRWRFYFVSSNILLWCLVVDWWKRKVKMNSIHCALDEWNSVIALARVTVHMQTINAHTQQDPRKISFVTHQWSFDDYWRLDRAPRPDEH